MIELCSRQSEETLVGFDTKMSTYHEVRVEAKAGSGYPQRLQTIVLIFRSYRKDDFGTEPYGRCAEASGMWV